LHLGGSRGLQSMQKISRICISEGAGGFRVCRKFLVFASRREQGASEYAENFSYLHLGGSRGLQPPE
jgi:hypothetical protein